MKKVKSARTARKLSKHKVYKLSASFRYPGVILDEPWGKPIINNNPSSREFGKDMNHGHEYREIHPRTYGTSPLIPQIVFDEIYKTMLNAQYGRAISSTKRRKTA